MSGFPGNVIDMFDSAPWPAASGRPRGAAPAAPLYTREQRARRDSSPWTVVQAVLAPVQFAIFLASLACVVHALATGRGVALAADSVLLKTAVLYLIMTTGAFWEKAVFGQWLFAPAFFWEDAFGFLVIALHTAAVATLFMPAVPAPTRMLVALAAYAAYLINAAQFVNKLRAARRAERPAPHLVAVAR